LGSRERYRLSRVVAIASSGIRSDNAATQKARSAAAGRSRNLGALRKRSRESQE
jgi:hypothetical protein